VNSENSWTTWIDVGSGLHFHLMILTPNVKRAQISAAKLPLALLLLHKSLNATKQNGTGACLLKDSLPARTFATGMDKNVLMLTQYVNLQVLIMLSLTKNVSKG
jgi:hypothetical protein